MQLRRMIVTGVLGVSLVGSGVLISRATGQDAPTSQPASRPARDPITAMFQRISRQVERLDGITDDQKTKIDDLFADTTTKLNDILTDEQKTQLQTQMQNMRNRMGGGRRGGGGGGANGGGGGNGGGGNGAGGAGGAPGQ
jgi:hypothetical protein